MGIYEKNNCRILGKGQWISNDDIKSGLNNNDLIIGGTGSGKTGGYVIPNIRQANGNMVITDTKSILYKKLGKELEKQGYDVSILDFVNPERSDTYNPLEYIRTVNHFGLADYNHKDIISLSRVLVPTRIKHDPFWEESARTVMAFLIAFTLEALREEDHCMSSIVELYRQLGMENGKKRFEMLIILGSLSRLFSTAEEPYLYYRAHENIFAKYFEVENNSRNDDSADACDIRNGIGIGLKTWVGQDNQKIAEFGRLRPTYADLEGLELVTTIAKYRNLRIRTTMNMHGLNKMLYHIVKRVPHAMCIYEAAYDYIDIENIEVDENRGNANSIYFTDGKHTYHFSRSKNTLYMIFDNMELMDEFEVQIYDDPYDILSNAMRLKTGAEKIIHKQEAGGLEDKKPCLCLRLYSTKQDGTKFVAEKSGLNQWNGVRSCYKKDRETGERIKVKETPRDVNELYIPYPSIDRNRGSFFPPRDTAFELRLPDGEWISAKVCQQDGKAIMSNPNNLLGKWLLRDVLELQEGTQITYEMLKEYGIDSVMFTKLDEGKYSIDFCELGTYEKVYGLEDIDAKNDVSDE